MRGLVARASLALLVAVMVSTACGDDAASPAVPHGGDAGDGNAQGGGGNGSNSGGALHGAGAPATPEAGAGVGGATADGGASSEAGASLGGHAEPGAGGLGGTSSEPEPGPPDFISASGGPWPDSFTSVCATTDKLITCPRTADAFFGQDGTYHLNVPTYKATATTLTDSVTGLVWQLSPEQTGKTQAEAAAYCDDLSLAGQTDWRLPTRLEYVSVLDEGRLNGGCMPSAVPQASLGAHWTASATGTAAGQYFVMNDNYGAWTVAVEETKLTARCVRGAALSGSRSAATDFVTDSMTGLVWQSSALVDSFVSWQDALAYCEGLTHADKDDWRLPSIKELATLVDESAVQAPVLYADLGGAASPYWSSTPAPTFGSERFAFALDTTFGSSPSIKMSELGAAARCVRTAD